MQRLLFVFLLLSLPTQAAPLISTVAEWNGTDNAQFWGTTGSATYGQVFTPTGSELILQDFSIFADSLGNPLQYRAYVQQWNQGLNQAVGNILFTSSTMVLSATPGFNQITINTGGLLLSAGVDYIAYFSSSDVPQPNIPGSQMGWLTASSADPNAVGFRFSNSATTFNPVTGVSSPWLGTGSFDLAFEAHFASIVTPAQEMEVGAALTPIFLSVALLGVAQRKRRQG